MITRINTKLNKAEYRDCVHACWVGKNIGGTMGAPYEGVRKTLNIQGFTTEAGKPMPNDDLDLQLVWLHAMEEVGPLAINAAMLGEFWRTVIVPNWNEYGIGKNNMRRGLTPPISGDYQNSWRDSNGAWIRTEVWACMAPGCPALAAKYAMEDAKVDHGAGEGSVAAAFVAAMQSAAFVIKDIRSCIELGLAAIPEKTRMADSIRFALGCYDQGMDAMDARNAVLERNADIGNGWFESPSNVSYAVIGLLWGQGDFKKAMITAINCGDDTDCTGATVGATMGILGGMNAIPEDWSAHIGDEIVTISINRSDRRVGRSLPETCTELTERVMLQTPHVLFANHCTVQLTEGASEIPEDAQAELLKQCQQLNKQTDFRPFSAHYESAVLMADVFYDSAPDICAGEEKTLEFVVWARRGLGDECINLTCRWWLPEGFKITEGRSAILLSNGNAHHDGKARFSFTIKAGDVLAPINRCVLEIVPEGRSTVLYVPIVFLS